MRYLTVSEVIELYRQVMEATGGTVGILSIASLESAVAQPRATFGGSGKLSRDAFTDWIREHKEME